MSVLTPEQIDEEVKKKLVEIPTVSDDAELEVKILYQLLVVSIRNMVLLEEIIQEWGKPQYILK